MSFLGSIGSAFQAAITRPGQNAANEQNARNGSVAKRAGEELTGKGGAFDLLHSQQQYGYGLEPERQAAYGKLLASYSPQAYAASAARQKNNLYSNNQRAINQAGVTGAGFGSGLNDGAKLAIANSSAAGANAIDAHYADPTFHQQQIASMIQAILGAQSTPALSTASGLAGLEYGQPQVQVGSGLLDYAAQALGASAGGGSYRAAAPAAQSIPMPASTGGVYSTAPSGFPGYGGNPNYGWQGAYPTDFDIYGNPIYTDPAFGGLN